MMRLASKLNRQTMIEPTAVTPDTGVMPWWKAPGLFSTDRHHGG
jgi:hypothetical protein